MRKILNYVLVFALPIIMFNCESEEAIESELSNFVGFEITNPMAVTVGNNTAESFEVKVYASEVASVDRSYGLVVAESSTLTSPYTVPSSVTIPAGTNEGTFLVSITDDENLQFVAKRLEIGFEKEAGVDYSRPIVLNVTETCVDTIVTLRLVFDNWAEEAYWELYDLSGTPVVIDSGGQGGVYSALDNTTLNIQFCLASGDYGIVVYDNYGDGGTNYSIRVGTTVLASGLVPDGGVYPAITSGSRTFTID